LRSWGVKRHKGTEAPTFAQGYGGQANSPQGS